MLWDGRILRVDQATFADDSFKICGDYDPVIDAQLPDWLDLRWYHDLAKRLGRRELKWQIVGCHWRDLSLDLRRPTLRALQEALIVIVDPALYRFSIERGIAAATRRPQEHWPAAFRKWMDSDLLPTYVGRSILLDSPASRIQNFLEDDGLILGSPGGIDGNTDDERTIITDLEASLGNAHNIRLFGARSAAAFEHLLDRDERIRAIESLWNRHFVGREMIDDHLFAAGERIERVFDEGNQPTVKAIAKLRESVRARLEAHGSLVIPEGTPVGVRELPSHHTPLLQAADIAAGYARALYRQSDGLRAVCEGFRAVVLNGSMMHDWIQVERPDAADLRIRR